ncbi:major urinary protein-like isoform X2 [Rattus rattus]|uniref:major urinary protein-like isoform X2 n=1 Tax=Rattus rattus TaxID=10117 RepID=UPI0013F2CE14|nr:major urinary protein-like isoform X2 [Rattus rattus]XP_032755083.1 major urinary protein-like isoform X2 [Rattus rattus]XP_032755084.1 major urinary protein-like isoform X2 [Rattus rattus]XP_032755085.1 major urinary protein-like isoform X2 [Rattus rattus]
MKLLLLLLWLGLTLVCGHAEEASSARGNLDVDKLNGDWFSIVVASNKREKIEENGSMRVFMQHIHVLENSLGFKFRIKENGVCRELYLVAYKTAKDGEYFVEYDGENTFTILKTDYDRYVMFHLVNVKNGETFQLMVLYGRTKDLSSDIKEKFAKLCEAHGITRDNIIDLTKTDRCLQARG